MTASEFQQIPPANAEIIFLFSRQDIGLGQYIYTITDLNISTVACNTSGGQNITELAEVATSITVELEGNKYTRSVYQSIPYDGYYYFDLAPIVFQHEGDLTDIDSCVIGTGAFTLINGTVPEGDFQNSDYDILTNNVQFIEEREGAYKVEYERFAASPSNLYNILSGSATNAQLQDFNYNATGIVRGRYDGSISSGDEYNGIPSALNLTSFQGATYDVSPASSSVELRNKENNFICSQSFSERPIKEYYFTTNGEVNFIDQLQGFSNIPLPNLRTILLYQTDQQFRSGSSQQANGTKVIKIPDFNGTEVRLNEYVKVEPGDVLAFSYLRPPGEIDNYENVQVQSVTYYSASNSGPISATTASISRNYLSEFDENTRQQSWDASSFVAIHKYTPDTIYSIEGNQPYKIRNKKLWLQDSDKVLYVDENGSVIAISKEC